MSLLIFLPHHVWNTYQPVVWSGLMLLFSNNIGDLLMEIRLMSQRIGWQPTMMWPQNLFCLLLQKHVIN